MRGHSIDYLKTQKFDGISRASSGPAQMSKRDGAPGPEPEDEIVTICRQVKRKLRKQGEFK